MEIKEAQQLAWENKIAKGFNTTDVPLEFMLLQGEIAESFQAWRRAQPDLGEELADVALYLFAGRDERRRSRRRDRAEDRQERSPPVRPRQQRRAVPGI